MKLVLASNNKNKLREIREIFSPLGYEVLSQSEAGVSCDPEENGSTFEENAHIKAKAVFDALPEKHFVIADDSGLCVDALDGAPGIYSARYAEDGKRCEKLLSEMADIPDGKRGAEFVCAVCLIAPDGEVHSFRGECRGKIGYKKTGTNGFGYDPVFMYGDKSFAEISAEEKNKVSHRANALNGLKKYLSDIL